MAQVHRRPARHVHAAPRPGGTGRRGRVELTTLRPPAFLDVLDARRRLRPHLEPTPLRHYAGLSALTGAEIWVKHENFQPTGAFKVRGGINLISRLSEDERRRGVISASTGNHGQSIAYAARLFGVRAIICAPAGANRVKVASMEELGAEVVLRGERYDDARVHCEQLARAHGYRYVHSGNEPLLIAGVATATLEVIEAQPELDAVIVPIGGGSGAAGACLVAKAVAPQLQVIGVQSEQAPAAFLSWRGGELVEAPNRTIAEGLATATAFALPQQILREHLTDFVVVDDTEIYRAVALMVEKTRTLVEAAAASPLAAALALKDRLAGKRVALICSGANITPEQLRQALDGSAAAH